MSRIPIFLSSDDNYSPYIATIIASICVNTKSICDFYILDGGITDKNKEKICTLKEKFKNFSIKFIKIDLEANFKSFSENLHYTKTMYTKFLIPYIEPNIKKAIYSDVDVIFFGDIIELYNEDLGNYALGAVWEDFAEEVNNIQRKKNLNLSNEHKYFSSGNLLINCEKWRECDILDELLKINREFSEKLTWPDQDILNKYFDSNYKQLDRKYCFVDPCYEFCTNKNFIIRHYTGDIKPWKISPDIKTEMFPDTHTFWYYAKMTPFYEKLVKNAFSKEKSDFLVKQRRLDKAFQDLSKKRNEGKRFGNDEQ